MAGLGLAIICPSTPF